MASPPAGKPAPPGQAKKESADALKVHPAKHVAPAGAGQAAQAPGQAKKSTGGQPPGQAKKAGGGQPLGLAKKSTGGVPPGQAKKSAGGNSAAGGTTGSAAPRPAARKRRGGVKASAAARRAARARGAARRRSGAARRAPRSRAGGGAAARAAGTGAAVVTAAAPATRATGESRTGKRDSSDKGEQRRPPFLPVNPRDELPQPFGVVRDIVEVVPTPLRVLVAGLVALSILLSIAYVLTLLRSRRLARQRRELLGQVGLLQAALLPELPENLGACRASVAYRPADGPGAGGDFYDVLALGGGKTAVLIGDVSGHGRAAIGRTALARYTVRAYIEAGLEPHEALQVAGSVLAGKLEGDFVTALVAVHDAAAGTLTYATAGHPPPIVLAGPQFDAVLVGTAPPLGVGVGTGQRQTTLPFPRGSVACFYTDGLSEARVAGGQLGSAGLEGLIRELGPEVTAEQVIDKVAATARTMPDDSAACVLVAEDGAAIVRSRVERLELSRAELRGPRLREFLDACGVSPHRVRAAENDAARVARELGGAVLEVRMADYAQVEVRPPEVPLRDDAAAYLNQPSAPRS